MRIRNKPGAINELKNNPKVIIGFDDHKNLPGNLNQLFDNKNPIHLEIGTGRGKFIQEMSSKYPDINFIGLEKIKEVLIYPARYAFENQIKNLMLFYGDALFLDEFFGPQEIERIYLNFSDPWPKKRHQKRRLTHHNFLDRYKRILKMGGEIHLKTDNRDFFDFSIEELTNNGFEIKTFTYDLQHSEFAQENILTEYEEKWTAQGIAICRLEAFWTGK